MATNPPWARDELIIALDLYLSHGQLDASHSKVDETSRVLNALPIHTMRPDLERFRNPNGVALKLANFAAIDPDYVGAGMSRGGKLDAQVWSELHGDPSLVKQLSAAIKAAATENPELAALPEDDEDEVFEGRLLFRLHRARERDRGIVRRKKRAVLAAGGTLAC